MNPGRRLTCFALVAVLTVTLPGCCCFLLEAKDDAIGVKLQVDKNNADKADKAAKNSAKEQDK
jgi:hypothetical protein